MIYRGCNRRGHWAVLPLVVLSRWIYSTSNTVYTTDHTYDGWDHQVEAGGVHRMAEYMKSRDWVVKPFLWHPLP